MGWGGSLEVFGQVGGEQQQQQREVQEVRLVRYYYHLLQYHIGTLLLSSTSVPYRQINRLLIVINIMC